MEENVLDEIFLRIQTLEEENRVLKEELNSIKDPISSDFSDFTKLTQNEKIEEMNNFKKQNNLPDFSNNHENKNLCDILITYKPYDQLDHLDISSDFTGWKNVQMQKDGESFIYSTKVLKGYSYKYFFHFNGNRLIDLESETIEGISNEIYNVLRIEDSENIEKFHSQINFESNDLFNMIEKEKKPILTITEEKVLLNKFFEYAKFYSTKNSEINKIKRETEESTRNSFENSKRENLKFTIQFLSIDFSEGYFKCLKLYDKNGIKIDINNTNNLNVADRFPFEKLYDNCYINTKEESDIILKDHNLDDKNILRIYYELISIKENKDENNINNNLHRLIPHENIEDFNNENNSEDIRMKMDEEINSESISERKIHKRPTIPVQKEIVPYKVTPDNIDLNNYNITIVDNVIKSVQSELDERLFICFDSKVIKEESTNEFKGLVSNSIMKVYTSIYNKDIVNVIHIHLNDTSQEISIDSKFLEKSEFINDHKIFKLDAYGKKLDYKLIFRDFNLVKIFYNLSENFIDEPHFEEVRLQEEDIVKINFNKSSYNGFFGKIKSLPIGLLSRKDKEINESNENLMFSKKKSILPSIQGDCEERHLEDLIGMIDITVMFGPDMSKMEKDEVISVPACKVVTLTIREQIPFETILAKEINNQNKDKKNKIISFCKHIKKLKEVCDNEKLNEISIEEVKEHLNKFEGLDIEDEFGISKLDDYESEKMTELLNEAQEDIPDIVFKMQIHVRNYYMFSKKDK